MNPCFEYLPCLLDTGGAEKLVNLFSAQEQEGTGDEDLLCVVCGHPITAKREGIAVSGSHEHIFRNPAGYEFRIGCFRSAPGCMHVGEYTDEHSWFPEYRWCFAVCSNCRIHMGWPYRAQDGTVFYGLILDRLKERP